jgi:hypothetical protein
VSEQSRTTQRPATVNASGKSTQTTTPAGSTQSQAAPDSAAASKVTRQLSRNSVPQPITAPAFQSVADFVSAFTDKKKTIDDLTKKFVAKVGEAKQAQDDILTHLVYMQSLLSKKGTNHHLVVAARKQGKKIPWWTDYFEAYKDKLWGSLRTMERRIAAYRNDPTEPTSKSDPDPVPHLNKSARKALIEGNHKAVEIVIALEAGRDGKKEIAEFKAVMNAERLDDIMEAHEQEPNYKGMLHTILRLVKENRASLPVDFVKAVDELAKGGDATRTANRDWSCAAGIAACEERNTARTAEKADGVSNTHCDDSSMAERPVQLGDGGSIPTSSLHFVPISKKQATELVVKNHYLHRKPIISDWETIRCEPKRVRDRRGRIKVVVGDKKSKKSLCWGIERDGQIVGVCTFGTPMWSVSTGVTGAGRWDIKLRLGRWRDCLELTRLWVDDSVTEHCIESKFVGWCLKEVKKINPSAFIVSYADGSAGHHGGIYQALGFIYGGLTVPFTDRTVAGKDHRSVSKKMQGEKIGNRRSWAGVNVERKKRSRKHRYVKFLNPNDEWLLAWKREPKPRKTACLSPNPA